MPYPRRESSALTKPLSTLVRRPRLHLTPPTPNFPPMSLQHDLQYATDLARGAGRVILDHFGKVERLTKTHIATTDEAVTDADRASQRYIVAGLRQRFAADGIIGE